jgi:lipoprotein Spr
MQNKKFLLFFFLLVTSLMHSQIVTSKKEALKKGIYEKPAEPRANGERSEAKKTAAVTTPATVPATTKTAVAAKTNKTFPNKPKRKKIILIDDSGDEDLVIGPSENYLAVQMINNAMDFIGVNYRGGGTSRAGMDCSGMITAVFDIFGMKLPRSSHEMAKVGEKINPEDAKKGDLVFFHTNGKSSINHVGMVIENNGDEIKFIHSSTQKGVIISSTKEPYYKRTFAQANRVIM